MASPRTALLLPGQGSQRPGMGRDWIDTPQWRLVSEASDVLGRDLAPLLLEADADGLRPTDLAQVSTHLMSLIALDAVRALVPDVCLIAGHSLGEYTALVAAGALDLPSGLELVAARGAAMRAAAEDRPGTMAAVLGVDAEQVTAACAEVAEAWPANYNGPQHVVISGTAEGVEEAAALARDRGARRVLMLPVGGAFHTPLMAPALAALETALRQPSWQQTAIPVISNVDARPHQDGWQARLAEQLLAPVRWSGTLQLLVDSGVERVIECGPGGVLTALARRAPGLTAISVSAAADLASLV
jgi:[acyl-carrier-protein] S-malonyltransferase